jgi:hypothetical protein
MVLTTLPVFGAYMRTRVDELTAKRCGRVGEKWMWVMGEGCLMNRGWRKEWKCREWGLVEDAMRGADGSGASGRKSIVLVLVLVLVLAFGSLHF